ncbi:carbohydrate esterase family 3 protein [Apiospora arundinis]|uniref:Carbohydrate esterase family 3 protein n=1 Tax=Apiospora arundinis TaxID=335852 RepID=A0ABR2HJQ9_9PEZI
MSSFNQEMPKSGGKSSGGRFGFLRTKRVLATLSLLVVVAIILIALGASGVFAGHHDNKPAENVTAPKPTSAADRRQFPGSIANGTALRIMPLGASTVRGENSPGNTGFRKPLRDALVALNVPVNMVGSQKVGDFPDNDVEAYLGVRVSQIHNRSKKAVAQYKPNIFVINAGINNALMNYEMDTAGKDMEKFIRDLLTTSPRALVVLSTLTPSRIPHCEPLIVDINQQFWDLYTRLKAEGLPIVVADVHFGGKDPDALQLSDITDDGTHPTGEGYARMARIYTKAIQQADSSNFLQVPVALPGVPDDGAASAPKAVRYNSAVHEHRRRFLHMKRELCITSNPSLWG